VDLHPKIQDQGGLESLSLRLAFVQPRGIQTRASPDPSACWFCKFFCPQQAVQNLHARQYLRQKQIEQLPSDGLETSQRSCETFELERQKPEQ